MAMRFYPVKVTKTQQYTVYVEAEGIDDALDVAAARLERSSNLVDEDPTDDYSIHASIEEDDERESLDTAKDALNAGVTYVVDHDGEDIDLS